MTDEELRYLGKVLGRLIELRDCAVDEENSLSLGNSALADEIDWLDCFIDQHARLAGLRASSTTPALGDGDPSWLAKALAAVDASVAECPVNARGICPEHCPKCGATDQQNCGPNVTALDSLAETVRTYLDSTPASPERATREVTVVKVPPLKDDQKAYLAGVQMRPQQYDPNVVIGAQPATAGEEQ